MKPVNNCDTTSEIPQPIGNAFLREKYGLTEEYEKAYPEDFPKVLSLIRSTEEALQGARELAQSSKELSKGMTKLIESSEIIHTQMDNIIESSEKNTQALQRLADSSSELREMTSNIANFAKRFFKPVQSGWNHFCFLTGYRTSVAILPGENPLAVEDNPENTISNTDLTNQASDDEKKKCANLLKFCMAVGGLYLLYSKAQRVLCYLSAKE